MRDDSRGRTPRDCCRASDAAAGERANRPPAADPCLVDAIVESLTGLFCVLDAEARLVHWNTLLEEITGLGAAELRSLDSLALVHEQDRPRVARAIREAHERGRSEVLARLLAKDGGARTFHLAGQRASVEGAAVLVCFGLDLTERHQAEEASRLNEERLRQAIRVSQIGIFDHDHGTDTIYWSPEQRAIYGWSADEPVTLERFLACVHSEDREEIAEAVRRAHDPGGDGSFDVEHRITRRDGETRWLVIRSETTFEGEGDARRPARTVGAVLDLTERRHAEEQLRVALRMESIGRLAGGIAHDFNNVLTAILGSVQLIQARVPAGQPARQEADDIEQAARQAAALTRQLLAYSRQQVLEPRVFELNAVMLEMDHMLRKLLGSRVRIATSLDSRAGRVKADPGQIQQVVLNLAVNARDAMPEGGTLTIKTADEELDESYRVGRGWAFQPGRYVLLEVSDTGTGMDPATCSRIFEPFFTTKEPGKGTGLGLSTVYGIVKQSGGHIDVESQPGEGTVFRIHLPRVDEAVAEVERPIARPGGGHETLLVVEADELVRRVMRASLASAGYRVLEATPSGALAIAARNGPRIGLVVIDLAMRVPGGQGLAARMRQEHPAIPVLCIMGHLERPAPRPPAPADVVLRKPFTPAALLEKVREALDGRRRDAA
jgi:PAS domain S-box-containing protein